MNTLKTLRHKLELLESALAGAEAFAKYAKNYGTCAKEDTLAQYNIELIHDYITETKTELGIAELAESRLHKMQAAQRGASGMSEGEGMRHTSSPDDLHGHPGLFCRQCKSSLCSGCSPTDSLYARVYVGRYAISCVGLYFEVLSSKGFANYQSGTLSLHS